MSPLKSVCWERQARSWCPFQALDKLSLAFLVL